MDEPAERTDRKIQRTATLSQALVKRATNAVYWCRMIPGEPASYSALTERAIREQVERLERTYNNGEPFEDGQLRPGPAPGVMARVAHMRRLKRAADDPSTEPEGEGHG